MSPRTSPEFRRVTPPLLLFLALVPLVTPTATAQQPFPPIADKTEGTTAMEGFFNLYWHDATGVLYWELDLTAGEFLYQISMGSGLGSNPVGIGSLRGDFGGEFTVLRGEIAGLRTEFKGELVALRGEFREDMAEFRAETRTSIAGVRTEMSEGFRQLDVRLRFMEEHLFLDQSAKQASA